MSKIYSEQFKADAVALVESRMSRRQVCADLGVSRSLLQKWVTDACLQAHGMSPSSVPEVAKEMSAAVKPIRELEMDNEVLRAAAAYVSQEAIRPQRSSRSWKKLVAQGKATLTIVAWVLKFSCQAFSTWLDSLVLDRQAQEAQLTAKIRQIHADDPEFGYRFIADELHEQGVKISQRLSMALALEDPGILCHCSAKAA